MEDILASIRRILSEDEAQPAAVPKQPDTAALPADPAPAVPRAPNIASAPDVLVLDPSMMVQEPPVPKPDPAPAPVAPRIVTMAPDAPPPSRADAPSGMAAPQPAPPPSEPTQLVAPEAAAAAASSVGALMRTLAAERGTAVHRGGPTIEDLVREEIRPLLKGWLDANLPPIVERLVRAEIERVVGRTAS